MVEASGLLEVFFRDKKNMFLSFKQNTSKKLIRHLVAFTEVTEISNYTARFISVLQVYIQK